MGATGAERSPVVEAMLLALSHSKLQPLTRGDVLRDILNIDRADFVRDGVLDLEVFWNVLVEHPEFDPGGAVAPMCAIKSWEERLEMDVRLPAKLQNLSESQIAVEKGHCRVPSVELDRALQGTGEQPARVSLVQQALDDTAGTPRKSARAHNWRDNRIVGIVAGAVLVGALVFLGTALVPECGSNDWSAFDGSEYAGAIPIAGAKELGNQVTYKLGDPAWLERPADERRDQMDTALRALEPRGTKALILRDDSGRVRATAQWYDKHTRIKVQLK